MTHQEILEKAIKKAIENGWRGEYALNKDYYIELDDDGIITGRFDITPKGKPTAKEQLRRVSIFNHPFAKALWGEFTEADHNHAEKKLYETASKLDHKKAEAILSQGVLEPWQYHLMQMVISDDPIKYLGDNI